MIGDYINTIKWIKSVNYVTFNPSINSGNNVIQIFLRSIIVLMSSIDEGTITSAWDFDSYKQFMNSTLKKNECHFIYATTKPPNEWV